MKANDIPLYKPYFELVAESPPHLKEALEKGLSFLSGSIPLNLILERMTVDGSSSQLYQFSIANESYVLKILDPKSCNHPSKELQMRKNEISAHQMVSGLGITPKFVYSDPKFLIIIMHFVKGRTLSHDDLQDPTKLEQLAKMLQILHTTPYSLSLRKAQLHRAKKYYDQAKSKGGAFPSCFAKLFDNFIRRAQELRHADLTLNHGDLHPGNILVSHNYCRLIDWAYASIDHPLSDIAYLTVLSGMNRYQTILFYNFYLGRVSSSQDLEHLERAQADTCLMLATALFNFSETEASLKQPIKGRIDRLNSLLESPDLRDVQCYITGTECIHPRKSHPSNVQRCALAFLKECIRKEGSLCNYV